MLNGFKQTWTRSRNNLSSFNKTITRGFKTQQLHFYQGAGQNTPSGIKVCIFGATSSMGTTMAGMFAPYGSPTIMVHRGALDVICPTGDDVLFNKSNPYSAYHPGYMQYDLQNDELGEMRCWTDMGMRYFQLVNDLTNEYDIETAIKDADVVINLIGNKSIVRHDENFEEPNVWIPREIARFLGKGKHKVKRFVHFSACGAGPDAISRRLRTKWQGEQEVLKYFPEATIIRPTELISSSPKFNFIGQYLHNWHNNNGHVYLLNNGNNKRQPVLDTDVCLGVYNLLQLEETRGLIYELGGPHAYTTRELMEYLSNILHHRPKYINYTYRDFMEIHHSPNSYLEKANHWMIARPDYIAEQAHDILVNKRDGVKTFEDLHIMPISIQHILHDYGQFMVDKLAVENMQTHNHDEADANDDAN